MQMNRNGALAAGAVMAMAFLAACSDSPTAPAARAATLPKSNFAVNDITTSTPVVGQLKICKLGNAGGTFVVTNNAPGQGGTGNPTVQTPIAVDVNTCRIAVLDNGDANLEKGDFFGVSENAAANTVQALTSCAGVEGPIACNNNFFVNNVHGVVLTYTNTFTPPPVGCTFTQGYWKTHGPAAKGNNSNVWPVQTLMLGTVTYSQSDLQSIFNAPVKGNGLIDLAHQLIAAKLNIASGASGSSIAATITAADALIGGLVVPPVGSGSLTTAQVSALVTALDNFNSGLTGPGHCDSEIILPS